MEGKEGVGLAYSGLSSFEILSILWQINQTTGSHAGHAWLVKGLGDTFFGDSRKALSSGGSFLVLQNKGRPPVNIVRELAPKSLF